MRYKKIIAILLISIFLLSSFLPITVAEESLAVENYSPNQNDNLLDRFFIKLFKWAYESFLGSFLIFNKFSTSWKAFRFAIPMIFEARPNTVHLEYLNETEIEIGIIDTDTNDFREEHQLQFASQAEYYEFNLEFPDDLDPDAWFYTFEDQVLYAKEGEPLKTKLKLYSTQPDYILAPTKLEFKINITRHVVYGNLYFPPKENRVINGGDHLSLLWFFGAIMGFGKYSGTEDITSLEIPLMIRADRFHLAQIITPETIEVGPDEIIKIPIKIQNLGTYKDSFNFRVTNSNNDDDLVISSPSAITLEPQETGTVYVGVASPRNFNDPGTLHKIKVEAFSIFDSEKVFSNEVSLTTRGIYVSDANMYYSVSLLFLIGLVAMFFYLRRRKNFAKYCNKPNKPWDQPKEQMYLNILKDKDKKKFDEVFSMMKDEYKSSLLWYKYYCNAMIQKEKFQKMKAKRRSDIKEFTPVEEKPKKVKKKPKEPEKVETPVIPEKPKKPTVDKKLEKERLKKQKAIERIKRKQK